MPSRFVAPSCGRAHSRSDDALVLKFGLEISRSIERSKGRIDLEIVSILRSETSEVESVFGFAKMADVVKKMEQSALSEDRMISAWEGNVRKTVGVVVEVLLIAYMAMNEGTASMPPGLFAALSAAAITVFRMGVESQ